MGGGAGSSNCRASGDSCQDQRHAGDNEAEGKTGLSKFGKFTGPGKGEFDGGYVGRRHECREEVTGDVAVPAAAVEGSEIDSEEREQEETRENERLEGRWVGVASDEEGFEDEDEHDTYVAHDDDNAGEDTCNAAAQTPHIVIILFFVVVDPRTSERRHVGEDILDEGVTQALHKLEVNVTPKAQEEEVQDTQPEVSEEERKEIQKERAAEASHRELKSAAYASDFAVLLEKGPDASVQDTFVEHKEGALDEGEGHGLGHDRGSYGDPHATSGTLSGRGDEDYVVDPADAHEDALKVVRDLLGLRKPKRLLQPTPDVAAAIPVVHEYLLGSGLHPGEEPMKENVDGKEAIARGDEA